MTSLTIRSLKKEERYIFLERAPFSAKEPLKIEKNRANFQNYVLGGK